MISLIRVLNAFLAFFDEFFPFSQFGAIHSLMIKVLEDLDNWVLFSEVKSSFNALALLFLI